jgi:hypothetical protein
MNSLGNEVTFSNATCMDGILVDGYLDLGFKFCATQTISIKYLSTGFHRTTNDALKTFSRGGKDRQRRVQGNQLIISERAYKPVREISNWLGSVIDRGHP